MYANGRPCLLTLLQALVEFGTIAQEDVDSLYFTDDPQEVREGTERSLFLFGKSSVV